MLAHFDLIKINNKSSDFVKRNWMKILVLINDPPYGTEARIQFERDPTTQLTTFLMVNAVLAAKAEQKTPDGYYNVERMLKRVLSSKGSVLLCGTCMDARGLGDAELLEAHAAAPWTNLQTQRRKLTKS